MLAVSGHCCTSHLRSSHTYLQPASCLTCSNLFWPWNVHKQNIIFFRNCDSSENLGSCQCRFTLPVLTDERCLWGSHWLSSRLWNDLYCVKWDVKPYYTIPCHTIGCRSRETQPGYWSGSLIWTASQCTVSCTMAQWSGDWHAAWLLSRGTHAS